MDSSDNIPQRPSTPPPAPPKLTPIAPPPQEQQNASAAPFPQQPQVNQNQPTQPLPAGNYNFSGTGAANTELYSKMPSTKLGFLGLLLSTGGIALFFILSLIAKAMAKRDFLGNPEPTPQWIGILAFISLVIVPIGTILCAIGCFEKNKRKTTAVVGLIVGLLLTAFVAYILSLFF